MIPVGSDYEDVLRRALQAATEQVEPAGDGLERIRQRMTEPWLKRRLFQWRTGWDNLLWLVRVRVESRSVSTSPDVIRTRIRMLAAMLERIGLSFTAPPGLTMTHGLFRRTAPAHRQPNSGLVRPGIAWLRSSIAVLGVVTLVVVSLYGLGQLRQTYIEITQWSGTPVSPPSPRTGLSPNSGTDSPAPAPSPSGGAVVPSAITDDSPTPIASPTCSPLATPQATPSTTPSQSPSASPSPSDTASATPSQAASATPNAQTSPDTKSTGAPSSSSPASALHPRCAQPGPLEKSAAPSPQPASSP